VSHSDIEIDASAERLRRFFVRTEGHYQISKAVRELCVFGRHNVATDPPFSRIDLVSCRNVLVYMAAALQKRVLPLLHYALNHDGFLSLGSSENVGGAAGLFEVVGAKNRIFGRNPAASQRSTSTAASRRRAGPESRGRRVRTRNPRPRTRNWRR
jgi:two-component system CheB/CheR fusion protein